MEPPLSSLIESVTSTVAEQRKVLKLSTDQERRDLIENLWRMLKCLCNELCPWELGFRIEVSVYIGAASQIQGNNCERIKWYKWLKDFSIDDMDPRGASCLVCGCAYMKEYNDKYVAICCYCVHRHEQHAIRTTGCKAAFSYGFVDWKSICGGKIEEDICEFHKQHFENLEKQKIIAVELKKKKERERQRRRKKARKQRT